MFLYIPIVWSFDCNCKTIDLGHVDCKVVEFCFFISIILCRSRIGTYCIFEF